MKKLTVIKLVDFKRKKEISSKKTFVNNLTREKEKAQEGGGGDYWISSVTAISNAYRNDDLQLIEDKINEIKVWITNTPHPRTKLMYKANIQILYKYVNFDFRKWQLSKMEFLKKKKDILSIKGLQIEANPHHVFSFGKSEKKEVGAIWFIAKKDGLNEEELGMFADILYRHLKANFSKDYDINSKYCIAVDVVKCNGINYSQIEKGNVQEILSTTVDEFKKILSLK